MRSSLKAVTTERVYTGLPVSGSPFVSPLPFLAPARLGIAPARCVLLRSRAGAAGRRLAPVQGLGAGAAGFHFGSCSITWALGRSVQAACWGGARLSSQGRMPSGCRVRLLIQW